MPTKKEEVTKKKKFTGWVVVKANGHQFKVSSGDSLTLDRVDHEPGSAFNFGEVLLAVDGTKVEIGQPVLKNVTVKAKVVEHKKDKKIRVARFEAKSRSRKVKGHRQPISIVEIVGITVK